jgi:CheY-like chemotaxis protein
MTELLRGEGYTVLEGSDGPSAIEASKKYKETIHLLVTDMVMPKMQGSELASELRKQRPGIKVLYITGYADSGRLPGANMLEKPFMPETLLQQIRSIFAQS